MLVHERISPPAPTQPPVPPPRPLLKDLYVIPNSPQKEKSRVNGKDTIHTTQTLIPTTALKTNKHDKTQRKYHHNHESAKLATRRHTSVVPTAYQIRFDECDAPRHITMKKKAHSSTSSGNVSSIVDAEEGRGNTLNYDDGDGDDDKNKDMTNVIDAYIDVDDDASTTTTTDRIENSSLTLERTQSPHGERDDAVVDDDITLIKSKLQSALNLVAELEAKCTNYEAREEAWKAKRASWIAEKEMLLRAHAPPAIPPRHNFGVRPSSSSSSSSSSAAAANVRYNSPSDNDISSSFAAPAIPARHSYATSDASSQESMRLVDPASAPLVLTRRRNVLSSACSQESIESTSRLLQYCNDIAPPVLPPRRRLKSDTEFLSRASRVAQAEVETATMSQRHQVLTLNLLNTSQQDASRYSTSSEDEGKEEGNVDNHPAVVNKDNEHPKRKVLN